MEGLAPDTQPCVSCHPNTPPCSHLLDALHALVRLQEGVGGTRGPSLTHTATTTAAAATLHVGTPGLKLGLELGLKVRVGRVQLDGVGSQGNGLLVRPPSAVAGQVVAAAGGCTAQAHIGGG